MANEKMTMEKIVAGLRELGLDEAEVKRLEAKVKEREVRKILGDGEYIITKEGIRIYEPQIKTIAPRKAPERNLGVWLVGKDGNFEGFDTLKKAIKVKLGIEMEKISDSRAISLLGESGYFVQKVPYTKLAETLFKLNS